MKEEELFDKVKKTKLPDIKAQNYQRRLKMVLLDTGYPARNTVTANEIEKGVIHTIMSFILRGLNSKQPVWKTAMIGVMAAAVVAGLALTAPLSGDSVYAQAAEIAQSSAEVKDALGGGEIQVIRIDLSDEIDVGKVVAKGEKGSVLAEVDLKLNKVTDITGYAIDEQAAIEIARSDARVQELLDSGASIGEVSTIYACGTMGNVATGETKDVTEMLVMVEIQGEGSSYTAYINLEEQKVDKLLEAVPMESPIELSPSGGVYSVPDLQAPDSGE